MFHAVVECLKGLVDSTTATSLFPALPAKLAALEPLVQNIVALAAAQEQPVGGQLEERDQALATASAATVVIAGAVLSYARTHGLPDLAAQVRGIRTQMRRLRRAERMRIAQRVHDVATPLSAPLADYGLTAGALDDFQAKIDATTHAVNVPVSTKAVKKVSTVQLNRAFRAVDRMLGQIDPMLLKLSIVDPKSHDLYLAARTVFARPASRSSTTAATAAPATSAPPLVQLAAA